MRKLQTVPFLLFLMPTTLSALTVGPITEWESCGGVDQEAWLAHLQGDLLHTTTLSDRLVELAEQQSNTVARLQDENGYLRLRVSVLEAELETLRSALPPPSSVIEEDPRMFASMAKDGHAGGFETIAFLGLLLAGEPAFRSLLARRLKSQ